MSAPVVIVGAGLAGLVAARRLNRVGREVLLLEATDRPGGRLKTDDVEGFRIDRGFQVYFTSYPSAKSEVVWRTLDMGFFIPGAKIWDGARMHEVRNDDDLAMAFNPFLPMGDKLRTLSLNLELGRVSWDSLWEEEDGTAEEMLLSRGFSEKFLSRFARPFFGGIFLDRSLQTSSRMFRFVWKMLNEGQIGVPAEGIEAIPRQIASEVPGSCIRTGAKVKSLLREDGQVCGVKLEDGEEIRASQVILAADPVTSARLGGFSAPQGQLSSISVSFDAPEPIGDEPMMILNGPGHGLVNHVADMTHVCPSYSPPGRRLISATILGARREDDMTLAKAVRSELSSWLPKAGVPDWRPLKVDRIAYAQMPQPPGFSDQIPDINPEPGLWLAGEYMACSSIDGAIQSGQKVARALTGPREPAIA